jgi:hypothetical protein
MGDKVLHFIYVGELVAEHVEVDSQQTQKGLVLSKIAFLMR